MTQQKERPVNENPSKPNKQKVVDIFKKKYPELMFMYVKDHKRSRQIGIIASLGKDQIGWSKCHSKLDKWDLSRGLQVAIGRALNSSHSHLPETLKESYEYIKTKAEKRSAKK
jgi:hypothetical protein